MHPSVPHPPTLALPTRMRAALAVALLAMPLSACNDLAITIVERAAFVHTEIVQPQDGQGGLTLTGEVQARFRADLSFRVSGRVLERLVDVAAAEMGIDRVELRRRNIIAKEAYPYQTPVLVEYDSGDPMGCLEGALVAADVAGFGARKIA